MTDRDILNIDEAAELLGVSIKTFNKVLHNEDMPARKIGREWKFSRKALIDWVGNGRSSNFYKDSREEEAETDDAETGDMEIRPQSRGNGAQRSGTEKPRARRTVGWQIED